MPTKKGAGGRQQNYNPNTGRYEKVDYAKLYYTPPTRKEKAERLRKLKREHLFSRAKHSKDEYLFEVFCEIENTLPYHVEFVNEKKFDPFINDIREFDIITKKCIIEIKGKNAKKSLKQFLQQKRYAEYKHKQHIVFSPQIPTMAKIEYEKHGIRIVKDYKSLINTIKEFE
ncbi:MAG: hypothetical protein E7358_01285 [Clostridiales bacterium]|nr:hypothetical protein [Clostridiales bacterium]